MYVELVGDRGLNSGSSPTPEKVIRLGYRMKVFLR